MGEEQQPLYALPQGHRLQEYELVRCWAWAASA